MLKSLAVEKNYNWNEISKLMNSRFEGKIRQAKQCRERYNDYICFQGIKQSTKNWKQEQRVTLLSKIVEHGISWMKIKAELQRQNILTQISCNTIKNYYYVSLKRFLTRINWINRKNLHPDLSWMSFRRFVSLNLIKPSFDDDISEQSKKAKQILEYAILREFPENQNQYLEIYDLIQAFLLVNEELRTEKLIKNSKQRAKLMKNLKNSNTKCLKELQQSNGGSNMLNYALRDTKIEQITEKKKIFEEVRDEILTFFYGEASKQISFQQIAKSNDSDLIFLQ